jgi:hypothetical protein
MAPDSSMRTDKANANRRLRPLMRLCVTKFLQKWVKEWLYAGGRSRFFAALQPKLTMQCEGWITGVFLGDYKRWKSKGIIGIGAHHAGIGKEQIMAV